MPQTWPPGLPFFERADDHARTGPQGAIIRTNMPGGPAKQRRRATNAPRGYAGSTPSLDRFEFALLKEFVEITLGDGAMSFEAVDPFDGLIKTFRFPNDPPFTTSQHGNGVDIFVSAELEIIAQPPRATVSQAARILGDPTTADVGDELTGVRAVFAGIAGRLADEWVRISTGEVVASGLSYTIRASDFDDAVAYRTRAINAPSSTSVHVTINGWLFDGTVVQGIRPPVDTPPFPDAYVVKA